jgi:hypothetical protein
LGDDFPRHRVFDAQDRLTVSDLKAEDGRQGQQAAHVPMLRRRPQAGVA